MIFDIFKKISDNFLIKIPDSNLVETTDDTLDSVATEEQKQDYVAGILRDPKYREYYKMPGCDRYTNSPCSWSKTDPIEDKCRMCGTQFPGWS
ncbi:MAG TPA: hypothetical protein VIY47_08705 [Ignavibacteriaceae bacterium]